MDEVDFTILAATSVFTDLIEKCPPAEACRDAFDRTAKATIKMANSTGGFGQVLRPMQMQAHKRRNSRGNGSLDDRATWSSASDRSGWRQHHSHQQRVSSDHSSRQQSSHYDMAAAASDAFSTSAGSSTKLAPPQQNPAKRFRPFNTIDPENGSSFLRHQPRQPHSTASSNDTLSPEATFDPTLGLSPSEQTGGALAAGSGSSASVPAASNFYDPLTNPNTLFADSGLQGLDFQQSMPGAGLDADFGGAGAGPGGGQDGTQMDLNFGLGWEGMHHDFSDGQQLDLFDGFFFGDQRGAGGGGTGMGFGMGLDQGTKGEGEGESGGPGQ